jgi:hypothetical protein
LIKKYNINKIVKGLCAAQVVECITSKHKVLSSHPILPRKESIQKMGKIPCKNIADKEMVPTVGTSRIGEKLGKECGRVNRVQIEYTQVCKWKK